MLKGTKLSHTTYNILESNDMNDAETTAVHDLESKASSFFDRGEHAQAEVLYRDAIRTLTEQLGNGWSMQVQYGLAATLLPQQKYEEAVPLLKELVAELHARTGRSVLCVQDKSWEILTLL